jgi:hypothetical protein
MKGMGLTVGEDLGCETGTEEGELEIAKSNVHDRSASGESVNCLPTERVRLVTLFSSHLSSELTSHLALCGLAC